MARGTILIVEDEPLVGMLLEDMLLDMNLDVVGPATRLEEGVRLAETASFDAAILDINLAGTRSYAIADVLRRRGIPFAFATGYGGAGVAADYHDVAVLTKPYMIEDVAHLAAALLSKGKA